jgi:hypothetical protein
MVARITRDVQGLNVEAVSSYVDRANAGPARD